MSRYDYSEEEKDILKALKLHEGDLKEAEDSIESTSKEIEEVKVQIERMARQKGIDISHAFSDSSPIPDCPIPVDEIPSWESILERANDDIDYQPILEDFFSEHEMEYSLKEIESLKEEFKKRTKLDKTDLAFLIIATLLQTLRWIVINKIMGNIGETIDKESRLDHDDKTIKEKSGKRKDSFRDKHWDEETKERASKKEYRNWMQIIYEPVPYDVNKGAESVGENMEGKYHRYRTLGHDPILGWIFGTANIITDTVTLSNWRSFRVARNTPSGGKKLHFSEPTTLARIFYESFDSVKEDKLRLPAAVFSQFVHLESDAFTKQGLPVPILEVFSEELAGKLYRSEYDALCLLRDIKTIGTQAAVSIFINMLIILIHGLFYDAKTDGEREHYEVRTRKILLYSNSMASVGNIAYSAATQDWGKLDIGGIIVTITRLFSDIRFITKMKQEFLQKELDKPFQEVIAKIDESFI